MHLSTICTSASTHPSRFSTLSNSPIITNHPSCSVISQALLQRCLFRRALQIFRFPLTLSLYLIETKYINKTSNLLYIGDIEGARPKAGKRNFDLSVPKIRSSREIIPDNVRGLFEIVKNINKDGTRNYNPLQLEYRWRDNDDKNLSSSVLKLIKACQDLIKLAK